MRIQVIDILKISQYFQLLLAAHRLHCGVLQHADLVVGNQREVLVGVGLNGGVGGLDSHHEVELVKRDGLPILDAVVALKLLGDGRRHRLREVF